MPEIGPILPEHAPVPEDNEKPSDDFKPDKREQGLIDLVKREFYKNKTYRQQYDHNWPKNYRFFRGVQWTENRPSYRHTEVVNFTFQTIQQQYPQLLDTRPRTVFVAAEPNDYEFAEIMDMLYQSDWERGNWLHQTAETILDGHIYGHGISSLSIEEDELEGTPRIHMRSEEPNYCFPNPDARDVNEQNESWIVIEPMEISRAKAKWPKYARYIKADLQDALQTAKSDLGQIRLKSPVDEGVTIEGQTTANLNYQNKTLCIKCYLKPSELAEDKEEKNGKTEYVQKKKYPKGRTIVLVSGVPVEDEEGLPYGCDKYAYGKFTNYILPREFYGISEVEQIEGPQRIFNKLVSFALDIQTMMGNPIWKVHMASGVDTDNVINRPGNIVEWDGDPAHEPRREPGLPIGSDVFAFMDRMENWFSRISGQNDVNQGIPAGGVTAARAIEALQEAGNIRIRQKIRNMDKYMVDMGQIYQDLALKCYTAPQVYSITGKDNAKKYFKARIARNESGKPVIHYASMSPKLNGDGTQAGGYTTGETKEYVLQGRLDVRVRAGSGLPFHKRENEIKAFQLYDRELIDQEEVFSLLDYPNKEKVMARMREAAAQQPQPQPQGGQ